MSVLRATVVLLVTLVLAVTTGGPLAAPAQAATATQVSVTATAAREGTPSTVAARLTTQSGSPLPGRSVRVDRYRDGRWRAVTTLVTDAQGYVRVRLTASRWPAANQVRAVFLGTGSLAADRETTRIPLVRRSSRLSLRGPASIRDGQAATLTVTWRTGAGAPVAGTVILQRRYGTTWRRVRTVRVGSEGIGSTRVAPGSDSVWRVRHNALPWLTNAASSSVRIDNVPPGTPVALPAGAPRPRTLPKQPRAVGAGANPVVTRIPDRVWNHMTGISWHRGCPVGRSGLRLLRINYWDFDGYRRRGEIVAAAGAIGKMRDALAAMYRQQLPIRSMYRVDRFGWSARLRGGNDYASMAADNTSAFNCRDVVGRPGVRSPHSYGRSLDVNPWENPYRSRQGVYPNSWWLSRSHPRVAWRSGSHRVVSAMRNHGMAWTYGLQDLHHFDARVSGRVVVVPGCADVVCH